MEFSKFIEYVFYSLISGVALYMASTIAKLRVSVEELNVNFAREIEKISNVKESLARHESSCFRHLEKLDCRVMEIEKKGYKYFIKNEV